MPVIIVARGSSEEDSPFSPDGVVSSSGVSVRGGAGEEAASFGRELEEIMAGVSNGEDRECKEEECSSAVAYHDHLCVCEIRREMIESG